MKLSRFNVSSINRFCVITSSVFLLSLSQFCLALPQYINEFHYDNTGADQFEYVEIAGLAGTDLSGWHLDFYKKVSLNKFSKISIEYLIFC